MRKWVERRTVSMSLWSESSVLEVTALDVALRASPCFFSMSVMFFLMASMSFLTESTCVCQEQYNSQFVHGNVNPRGAQDARAVSPSLHEKSQKLSRLGFCMRNICTFWKKSFIKADCWPVPAPSLSGSWDHHEKNYLAEMFKGI